MLKTLKLIVHQRAKAVIVKKFLKKIKKVVKVKKKVKEKRVRKVKKAKVKKVRRKVTLMKRKKLTWTVQELWTKAFYLEKILKRVKKADLEAQQARKARAITKLRKVSRKRSKSKGSKL